MTRAGSPWIPGRLATPAVRRRHTADQEPTSSFDAVGPPRNGLPLPRLYVWRPGAVEREEWVRAEIGAARARLAQAGIVPSAMQCPAGGVHNWQETRPGSGVYVCTKCGAQSAGR